MQGLPLAALPPAPPNTLYLTNPPAFLQLNVPIVNGMNTINLGAATI